MFDVKISGEGLETLKLMKEWEKRTVAFFRYFSFKAAETVFTTLQSKVPSASTHKDYKKSLTLANITGMSGAYGAAVYAKVPNTRLNKLDPGNTLIYVVALKRPSPISKGVKILVDPAFNPWTADTIPYYPPPKEAKLIYRKVSVAEVERTRQAYRSNKSGIEAQLARAGVKVLRSARARARGARKTKVSASIVEQAIEMEFGSTAASNPHWKPSILRYVRSTLPALTRADPRYLKVFTDYKFNEWKKWDKMAPDSLAESRMSDFEGFFKKLALSL